MCVDRTLSIRSFAGGHLWATVDNAAADTGVQTPLQGPAFNLLRCTSGSGVAGSYGNSGFNFLRACHAVFHCSYTILRPPSSAQLERRAMLSNSHEGTPWLSGGPACMQSPRGQNSRDPVPCSKGLLISQDSTQTALNRSLA